MGLGDLTTFIPEPRDKLSLPEPGVRHRTFTGRNLGENWKGFRHPEYTPQGVVQHAQVHQVEMATWVSRENYYWTDWFWRVTHSPYVLRPRPAPYRSGPQPFLRSGGSLISRPQPRPRYRRA